MKKTVRITFTFLTGLATYYFIYWIPFSLIPGAREIAIIPVFISLLLAIGMGVLVWNRSEKMTENLSKYVLLGGIFSGAIFFLLGFVGPILFFPSVNLGPLLGLVITGPIGFLLGLLGGGIYWRLKIKDSHQSS